MMRVRESVVMSTCKDMCAERTRSSSLGRARGYRARYWAYLLDNLQKAKDEICDVCERDQDILACKEALLVLNNYSKELIALIELIRLNDKLEKTPEPCRPSSLSWEVRKPGGSLSRMARVSPVPPRYSPLPQAKETCTVAVQTINSGQLSDDNRTRVPPPTPNRPASGLATRVTSKNSPSSPVPMKSILSTRNTTQKAPLAVTPVTKKPLGLAVSHARKLLASSPTSTLRKQIVPKTAGPPPVKQTTSSLLRRCATTMGADTKTILSQRTPNVTKMSESTSSLSSSTSSKSWAETVKGGSMRALSVANNGLGVNVDSNNETNNDDDGWKVVNHHKVKAKSPSPLVIRSPSVPEIIRKRPSGSPATVFKRPSLSLPQNESWITKSLPALTQKLATVQGAQCGGTMPPLQKSHTTFSIVQRRDKENDPVPPKVVHKTPQPKSAPIKASVRPVSKVAPTRVAMVKPTTRTSSVTSRAQEKSRPNATVADKLRQETDNKAKAETNKIKRDSTIRKSQVNERSSVCEKATYAYIPLDKRSSGSAEEKSSTSSSMEVSTESVTLGDSRNDPQGVPQELTIFIPESVRSDSVSEVSPRSVDKNISTDGPFEGDFFTDRMAAAIWINKQGLSLADQVEFLDQIEQRVPGRATKVHEKLSSPRKGVTEETLRKHEQRQAKAQEHRDRLKEERAQNYRDILRKVEEHKAAKEEESKTLLQRAKEKQDKADKNREEQLRRKVQKAHDEKEKVQEIAFINTLEAQNKRHDIFEREKESDMRIQERQKKHQQKLEEKAAREAAAEERRKALEEEWQVKVNEILERRADRDRKLQQQQQEKEAKRQAISKINELVRERVNAPGCTPYETKKMCSACNVLITSEVYLLSHLKSGKHQEAMLRDQESYDTLSEDIHSYSLKYIIDAPIDEKLIAETEALRKHLKAIQKKRCRKLKQKILLKSKLYENQQAETNSSPAAKERKSRPLDKQLRELARVLQQNKNVKGVWTTDACNALERPLGDLERLGGKSAQADQQLAEYLSSRDCLPLLIEIAKLVQRNNLLVSSVIPAKAFGRACHLLRLAIDATQGKAAKELLQGNGALALIECQQHLLAILVPDDNPAPPKALVASCAFTSCLFHVLQVLCDRLAVTPDIGDLRGRVVDLISYTVSVGILDKLMYYFTYIQRPRDCESQVVSDTLLHALHFVAGLVRLLAAVENNGTVTQAQTALSDEAPSDSTQLLFTLRRTDAMGVVALLYSTLLCQGATPRGKEDNGVPARMPQRQVGITLAACHLLTNLASAELSTFQEVLGREGVSLQIRHIASYLLWYCSHHVQEVEERKLLHQVLLLVGFFAVDNRDNQNVIHTGGQPTVLQMLCKLPFDYFCDNMLRDILIPTLLACCSLNEQNTLLLCEEISPVMLLTYLEEKIQESSDAELPKITNDTSARVTASQIRRDRPNGVWAFNKRFPQRLWPDALEFLRKTG
ncbi:S phase cyclin A-associated protein in the endoplasmic reticulum-like isoform X2 [Varroa destructor]|uniref:S phase cyclin A-associated protein in the endoplasmic reticulum n=1 Tax=Varroa destructor TaxID=109461 RepID=A0A7M7JWR7_VARDE|nr:S phase cyclin A-associated protein in the endoplasmic reticulum-like isoform X2 [Varroa destructor]